MPRMILVDFILAKAQGESQLVAKTQTRVRAFDKRFQEWFALYLPFKRNTCFIMLRFDAALCELRGIAHNVENGGEFVRVRKVINLVHARCFTQFLQWG